MFDAGVLSGDTWDPPLRCALRWLLAALLLTLLPPAVHGSTCPLSLVPWQNYGDSPCSCAYSSGNLAWLHTSPPSNGQSVTVSGYFYPQPLGSEEVNFQACSSSTSCKCGVLYCDDSSGNSIYVGINSFLGHTGACPYDPGWNTGNVITVTGTMGRCAAATNGDGNFPCLTDAHFPPPPPLHPGTMKPIRPDDLAPIFSSSCSEPRFEVMIKRAFLQLTVLPLLSVSLPSSKICRKILKTSGWAFSTSSSKITL